MHARQYVYFCAQRSDFFDTTTVGTFVFSQNHSSNSHFFEFVDDFVYQSSNVCIFFGNFCQSFCQLFQNFFCDDFDLCVTILFQFCKNSFFHSCVCDIFCYQFVSIFGNHMFCVRSFFLTFFCCDFLNEFDYFQVGVECQMNSFHHQCVRDFVCACFDHHNFIFFGRYSQSQSCFFSLFCCGVHHQFAVHITDAYGRNGICERNIGNVQRQRCADHGYYFRRAVLIYGHYCCNDSYVVSVILREQRTQRSVDTSCCQDCFFGRSAFSFDETAGDFTYGIQSFFVINAQREEVNAISGLFGCSCSNQYSGIAVTQQYSAVSLFCYSADFSCQCSACQFHGIGSKHVHSPFLSVFLLHHRSSTSKTWSSIFAKLEIYSATFFVFV